MKLTSKLLLLMCLGLLAVNVNAKTQRITVPKGTAVTLVFDDSLDSRTTKVGDSVALHVQDDVTISGQTILSAGTKVTATVSQVNKGKHYGVNAKMRLAFNPVKSTSGEKINLVPSSKGQYVGGKKSTEAAGATAGGAVLLGPVGLVGGYFVVGKPVSISVGDQISTEVLKSVKLLPKK